MKITFPQNYGVKMVYMGDNKAQLSTLEAPSIIVGPPPQFMGSVETWSPKDLFLASINSCLFTTYFALAKRHGLEIESYSTDISGILDKTREGIVFLKSNWLGQLSQMM